MLFPEIKIIDTHQHAFWHWRDASALLADMETHGIEQAWLLTWEIPEHPRLPEATIFTRVLNPARLRSDGSHPGILLKDLLETKALAPERFLLGYCPDPAQPNAVDAFEAACSMYDIRICGEWKYRMLIDDPRSIELFRAAGRLRTPVVLHLDPPYLPPAGGKYESIWYGGTVSHLENALKACPDTLFIGHAPGFWREMSADADGSPDAYPTGPVVRGGRLERLLETYPNLYADLSAGSALSALNRDLDYTRSFFLHFYKKLLFARDYYGGELLSFLKSLELPENILRAVLRENALSILPPSMSHPTLNKLGR